MQERIIIARRWKTAATMPLALIAIALGVWALSQPDGVLYRAAGWAAIFFGAGAIPVLLVQCARPTRLRLSPEALVIDTGLARPKTIPWRDLEGFYLWRVRGAKFPAFRYVDGFIPRNPIGRALRDNAGVDGALTAPWPLAPEALVNVLNQYRLHFSR
jgi:hypothetical protein